MITDMFSQPFRLRPQGNPQDYRTFDIRLPDVPEVWQPATCEDIDCEHYLNGWRTSVPTGGELDATVKAAGRPYTATVDGGFTVYTFAPGTPCFRASTHRVRTEHPGLFVVREGDWRGNPRGTAPRVHARPDDWVEDLQEHTESVRRNLERG